MKVAYLTSRYPAVSHTFILSEIHALRERGIDVHTFTIRRAGTDALLTETDRQEYRNTLAVLPVSPLSLLIDHAKIFLSRPPRYLSALWSAIRDRPPGFRAAVWHIFYFLEAAVFARALCRHGLRHVHVHFTNVASEVAMLAARMLSIRWSLTVHGLADFGNPIRSRLRSKIADASFVVCVSDFGRAQAMLHNRPEHWSKIHVVRCGIDPQSFTPGAESHADRSGKPLRLLNVARLGPEKGHLVLLDAIKALSEADVDVVCTLVGEGPERARLEECIRRLGIGDRVRLAGAVGQEELIDYYHAADLFVLPSLAEGLPVVLMEAMACGLPVVASRIAGIPELVEDGVSGLLVPAGRADALAAGIGRLAADVGTRRKMARHGRERVIREYDGQRCIEPLFELFSEALGVKRACDADPIGSAEPQTISA